MKKKEVKVTIVNDSSKGPTEIKVGDTVRWNGVNRTEEGMVNGIEYHNSRPTRYLVQTKRGFVYVGVESVIREEEE